MNHCCTVLPRHCHQLQAKQKECWTGNFRLRRIEDVAVCDPEKAPEPLPFKPCYRINFEPLEIAREKSEELILRGRSIEYENLGKGVTSNGSENPSTQIAAQKQTKANVPELPK